MLRTSGVLAAFLLAAAPAHAATPLAARQAWDARLEEQRQQLTTLRSRANAAAQAFMAAEELDANVATAEAGGVYVSTQAAALLAGRSEMLEAWRAFSAGNPSPQAATAWVRQRADDLKVQARSVATSEANMKANVAAGESNPFTVVISLERLYRMGSYTEGAALELQRISGELADYFGSPAPQAAEWQASFGGLAEMLRREQTALRGWSMTCGAGGCAGG